jgi:hypothetical protein
MISKNALGRVIAGSTTKSHSPVFIATSESKIIIYLRLLTLAEINEIVDSTL